jgi:hypothetical protein
LITFIEYPERHIMLERILKRFHKPDEDTITIVSGLPRSGTSMMMKMLEAGGMPLLTDNIRKADEDNPEGYYEFERAKRLREGDFEWLPSARGKVVKIIATLLPHLTPDYVYRVVFMRRAIAEILASQRQMLIRRGEDPDRIGDADMAALFEQHLQKVDAWIDAQANVHRIDVNYNQLLEDPDTHIARVNAFLGGGLDTEIMVEVVDPALYRQRKSRLQNPDSNQ